MRTITLCNQLERLKPILAATGCPFRYLSLIETRESRRICEYLKQLPDAQELPRALRVSQVARLLGVARSTAYGWVRDGLLPACRVGTVVLILSEDLEAFLRAHRLPTRGNRGPRETLDTRRDLT